jgi:hypothetical protein
MHAGNRHPAIFSTGKVDLAQRVRSIGGEGYSHLTGARAPHAGSARSTAGSSWPLAAAIGSSGDTFADQMSREVLGRALARSARDRAAAPAGQG